MRFQWETIVAWIDLLFSLSWLALTVNNEEGYSVRWSGKILTENTRRGRPGSLPGFTPSRPRARGPGSGVGVGSVPLMNHSKFPAAQVAFGTLL